METRFDQINCRKKIAKQSNFANKNNLPKKKLANTASWKKKKKQLDAKKKNSKYVDSISITDA